MPVIQVQNLSKKYAIYKRPSDKLREALHLSRGVRHNEFWALQDVSFEVDRGQTLGIIGQNGSGKSTLLQILAGIMRQTHGDCFVTGKVSALLELGSGFNPEFTGRENVYMNGAILGMNKSRMLERFDAIAKFAEIGSFMDQPVKTYSSGMFMRLAFAVAVNVDPEILLVDEALAVGDLIFQHRCMHRMNQLRAGGKTTLLVTHDLGAVTKFCDRALLLDGGRLLEDGPPEMVVNRYRELIFERERRYGHDQGDAGESAQGTVVQTGKEIPVVRTIPNIDHRFGNGKARVIGVELMDRKGCPTRDVMGGHDILLRVSVEFLADVPRPILGYTLRDRLGVEISACNTTYAGTVLPAAEKSMIYTTDFHIHMPRMAAGSYSISPAVAEGDVLYHDMCDWIDNGLVFSLQGDQLVYGMLKMDVDVRSYASGAMKQGA
jgi:ABC-type polysaccharide/polyol phosphate transport system ATPase subunit